MALVAARGIAPFAGYKLARIALYFSAVNAATLVAWIKDGKVGINDEKGGTAWVTATDLNGSNGVVHVIDTVLMPK